MSGELAIMAIQAAALFRLDAAGRILAINESDPSPAPRLFIGRTGEGNRWHCRHDLPESLACEIDALLVAELPSAELRAPLRCDKPLRALLHAHAPIAGVWSGPAWYCPAGIAAPRPVAAVQLTASTALEKHFPGWARDFVNSQPCIAVLDGDDAVAVCCSSRLSPDAAEAGAETVPGYRGRGYAASTVAAWATAIRATGRLPLYSTAWDNLASQGVARTLGLTLYGADLSFS
ncbi:MAG TPA: GNAT family N-acetyltransferase [Thermomicrobiales bacterium]|jgi:RimJ/RimL family protein N-acetyltransferase